MQTISQNLKLMVITLLILMSSTVWAAYVKNMPQTLKQPDGTVLHVFATGDENYNYLHDADGYTIVYDKATGYYVYATKVNGRLAPTSYIVGKVNPKSTELTPNLLDDVSYIKSKVDERKNAKANYLRNSRLAASAAVPNVRPGTGTYNNIVVFIQFADQDGGTITRATAESRFNELGVVSVKDFYKEVSNSQLNVNATFYPAATGTYPVYYKDSHPRSYYCKNTPDGYGDGGYAEREHLLLKNAIDAISSQVPGNLNIDGNNDGFVDNVTFVINGETDGWGNLLWPHRWGLFTQTAYIGTKQVYDYNNVYTSDLGVGVISHEMFHSFGAPDLYEYTNWSGITPVGMWDVMAANNWDWPQHMTVYLKARYGTWTTIPEITTTGTYTLQPVSAANPFAAYKIKLPNSTENEYMVLEYKKKDGRYEVQNGGPDGLLIYRINETGNNAVGPEHEVYVYRKDGSKTADGDIYNAAFHQSRGTTTFNDNSNPAAFLSNGSAAGFTGNTGISNIVVSANSVSFTYIAPGSGNACTDPEWTSTGIYTTGMKVSFNGRKYTANYWTQNNRPDQNCCVAGEEWSDNGPCASNIAPIVSITAPANNSNIPGPAAVTISASANDADGTISKVEFLNSSNAVVFTDNAAPFEYTTPSLTLGSYTFKAIAYDNQNLASNAATVTFNIVGPAPTITITSPAQDQVFNLYPSDGNLITVNVTTNPANVDSVQYIMVETVCGGPGCTVVRRFTKTVAPYTLTYSPTYNANGWSQANAIAFKNGVASTAVAVSYYVKPLPEVTIVSPTNNTAFPPSATVIPMDITVNNDQVHIDSVVYNVTDTKVTGQVGVSSDRKFVVTSGTFDLNIPIIAGKSFSNIYVLAYGNGGKFSKVKQITVYYNEPPVVTITAPLPVNGINPKYLVGGSMKISATATDADGINRVVFSAGNNVSSITDYDFPYFATFVNLPAPYPDGSFYFTVTAYDNQGNSSSKMIVVYKNRIPSVSITAPANNATFTIGSNVVINALVYDPDMTSGKVEFFNGAAKLGEVTSAPYNFTISNIGVGNYVLTAKVTDDMGESGVSNPINITVPPAGCNAPQYVVNGGYVAGSRVKNNGVQYECKPYPYTGWCNGAAWAYAPGTGTYWTDAWIQIGACRMGEMSMDDKALEFYPNPASEIVKVTYVAENTGEVKISIVNQLSTSVMTKTANVSSGENEIDVNVNTLENGMYLLRIEDGGKVITKKISVLK